MSIHPLHRQILVFTLGGALCGSSLASPASPTPKPGTTTVYRCGQTYQQVPCRDGQAVAVGDERDPAQRQAAQRAAAQERRAANDLTAERLAREQPARPAKRQGGVTPVLVAEAPVAGGPIAKHARAKAGKHPRPLEATDKTLYAPRGGKKLEPEAKMPAR